MPHDLHVVLVEPEIPQNTGTIGRLCLGVGATLHLVEPMAFQIDDSKVKRAGLDYWEHIKIVRHASIDAFLKSVPVTAEMVFLETRGGKTLYEHAFKPGTYLVFGKETFGLPDWLLNQYSAQTLRIPIFDARVRSFNLSNSVSVAVYEAIRQLES